MAGICIDCQLEVRTSGRASVPSGYRLSTARACRRAAGIAELIMRWPSPLSTPFLRCQVGHVRDPTLFGAIMTAGEAHGENGEADARIQIDSPRQYSLEAEICSG